MNLPVLPFAVILGLIAAGALLWLFLSAAFLLWGARLAGIEKRSFVRAIGTILLGGLASLLLAAVLSAAPLVGTGAGLLLGFCVSAAVMMVVFDTTFGKAFAANLLAWLLPFLILGALVLLGFALLGILLAVA